jgi:hypothetical protein
MKKKTRGNAQRKQRCCNGPWRPQAATGLPIHSSENRGLRLPFNPFAVAQGGHHSLAPFALPTLPSPLPPSHSFCRALRTGCMCSANKQEDLTRTDTRNKAPDQTEVRDGAAI